MGRWGPHGERRRYVFAGATGAGWGDFGIRKMNYVVKTTELGEKPRGGCGEKARKRCADARRG